MATFRVALLQMVSAGRDRDANRDKGLAFCRRAAELGADLVLFPELWSVGYEPFDDARPGDREAWQALAVSRNDDFVARHRALARELSIAIGVTYLERTEVAPRNALTLFDRHGEAALHFAKAHLCPWGPPDTGCSAGDAFPVGTLDTRAGPVRVGAMICFDREFPESAKLLALGGAELILAPNACDLDDRESGLGDLRLAQFRARAFENLVAVAMANYAAPQQDGHSCAYYPDGATIVLADDSEGVVIAEIDPDRVRAFRAREAGRTQARRPDLYAAISGRKPGTRIA